MTDETLIIGGGFAGLAAAVALAGAGRRVRVLEQKPYLGGRARSFRHAPTGAVVDNGQHIFMGCYHETIKFLSTIGTADRVRFQPRLSVHFADRSSGLTSLDGAPLPAPWHLLGGVLKSNAFSFGEKMEILRLGRALRSADSGSAAPASLTVDGWMERLHQSERLRRNFWDLLCIAALNEDSKIAAAAVFEPVLRLALFRSAADSRIGFATSGLSECYTDAAAEYIRARGGEVDLGIGVAGLLCTAEGTPGGKFICRGVRLGSGEEIEARAVISAAPAFQFGALLPEHLRQNEPYFGALDRMRPSPIVSLNLWLDRDITDEEFVGLRGTTVQWLFNRRKITGCGEPHVSLVISGAHEYIRREKEDLLALAVSELRSLFPEARGANIPHSLVIKERFATFSPDVDAVAHRPGAVTPVRGLYLAGDWTATGLPATIESAVQSGYTAASEVMRASA